MNPGPDDGFAYVLMSHVDPDAVLATARRIRELSPRSHVLVRHAGAPGFAALGPSPAPGVEVLASTTALRWGTFSVVRGVVEALEEARTRWRPTHTVVVSGQDHPVRDLGAWEASVVAGGADALVRSDPRAYPDRWARCWHPLPDPPAALEPVLRVTGRLDHGRTLHHAGDRTWFLAHHRTALRSPLPYRKGSLWMTLSAAAVGELSRTLRDRELVRWFSSQLLSDEAFAPTVLGAVRSLRVDDVATTTAFFPDDAPAHPRALTAADLDAVRRRQAPFARKVVAGVSDAFVALLDAAVDDERSRHLQRR